MELHAYVPFDDQSARWKPADQHVWRMLRSQASKVVVVGGTKYDVRMLHARNEAMIAAADAVIAVWDRARRSGGAATTAAKAFGAGKPVLLLDPAARTVGWLLGERGVGES